MYKIVLAVADGADADPIRAELEDFGYRAEVVEGCEDTLDAFAEAGREGVDAFFVDSKLVGILAGDHRDIVEELTEAAPDHVPLLVYMTKPLSSIHDPLIRTAVKKSDSVIHAPVSGTDIHLRLRSLSAYH